MDDYTFNRRVDAGDFRYSGGTLEEAQYALRIANHLNRIARQLDELHATAAQDRERVAKGMPRRGGGHYGNSARGRYRKSLAREEMRQQLRGLVRFPPSSALPGSVRDYLLRFVRYTVNRSKRADA